MSVQTEDTPIEAENTDDNNNDNQKVEISEEFTRIEELENSLNKSLLECDEKTDQLLRVTADMQNIRRRAENDRVKLRNDGAISIITPLVTVLDNFSRAFAHIPEELQANDFINSLHEIEKGLEKNLVDQGVSFFTEAGDNFNAELHESMMIDSNAEAGKIAQVFEKGVMYKSQVVRHAKVSVGG